MLTIAHEFLMSLSSESLEKNALFFVFCFEIEKAQTRKRLALIQLYFPHQRFLITLANSSAIAPFMPSGLIRLISDA